MQSSSVHMLHMSGMSYSQISPILLLLDCLKEDCSEDKHRYYIWLGQWKSYLLVFLDKTFWSEYIRKIFNLLFHKNKDK